MMETLQTESDPHTQTHPIPRLITRPRMITGPDPETRTHWFFSFRVSARRGHSYECGFSCEIVVSVVLLFVPVVLQRMREKLQ